MQNFIQPSDYVRQNRAQAGATTDSIFLFVDGIIEHKSYFRTLSRIIFFRVRFFSFVGIMFWPRIALAVLFSGAFVNKDVRRNYKLSLHTYNPPILVLQRCHVQSVRGMSSQKVYHLYFELLAIGRWPEERLESFLLQPSTIHFLYKWFVLRYLSSYS